LCGAADHCPSRLGSDRFDHRRSDSIPKQKTATGHIGDGVSPKWGSCRLRHYRSQRQIQSRRTRDRNLQGRILGRWLCTPVLRKKVLIRRSEPGCRDGQSRKRGHQRRIEGGGELSGRVTVATTNLPAANVSVKATNTNTLASFPSWSVVTNGNGEYVMLGLETGAYKVEFAAAEPGAAQYISQTLTRIALTQIGTKGVNVVLVRKAPVNTGPPVLSG